MTRRILVARLDSVGDVIVSGPAVRAIAAHGEVWMLCSRVGAPAARLLPGVHRVLEWDCPWITNPAPPATAEAIATLRSLVDEADVAEAVILTSFRQSPLPLALQLRLAGVGRISAASTDYAGSLLDTRLKPGEDFPENQPEPLRALEIARAAGFALPAEDRGLLRVLPTPNVWQLVGADPYLVVHPGASVPSRRWPPERHRDAVRMLANNGWTVLVTGTASEAPLTGFVAGDHGVDLGGRTSLAELAGILGCAAAVVVGNTGPAHLAAAVGTPIVSLYSPVVPAVRWAPWGVPVALLGDQDAACRNSRARECPVPGHPCLTSISAADVVRACEGLVGSRSPESRLVTT